MNNKGFGMVEMILGVVIVVGIMILLGPLFY